MHIKKIIISNFRGIKEPTEILFNDFTCIVGKNDVGKSTVLKAVDAFLNDTTITVDDKNVDSDSSLISIAVEFDTADINVVLDDTIPTSFKKEDIVSEDGFLKVKKVWDTAQVKIKPKWYVARKKHKEDFLLLTEKELINLCIKLDLSTQKANGEEYNNKEKREKIRKYYQEQGAGFVFEYSELPTTGTTRLKKIYDAIRKELPSFEYFKADSSLSDSDTSVQKYFKDKALKMLNEQIDTADLEEQVREKIADSLNTITEKINSVLSAKEQIQAQVNFDWSKLVSTAFKCKAQDVNIPLSSRGDGFRRITMMSYFEMLAEERHESKNVIFGFEEPETFLHPTTQRLLSESLKGMSDNGYQVVITTHSPNIVSLCDISNLVHITKNDGQYLVMQNDTVNVKSIVEDLGIKSDDSLLRLFDDNIKGLFLVEGPDDVKAYRHVAKMYKQAGVIDKNFDDCKVVLIPVGGCSSIQHWTNFDVIKKIGKPYFILLDSDKESTDAVSPNLTKLHTLGYSEKQCGVTRKREIECYIPESYFAGLTPPIKSLHYGDWDDVKKLCQNHEATVRLGGKKVCDKHFCKLSFAELKKTFCPSGNDADDEFLDIYNKILAQLK